MTKIGLISDTHGFLDPAVLDYFEHCDQIWHAGDVGNVQLISALKQFKPTIGVFGNIDDRSVQIEFPEDLRFNCEGFNIWITHIGGAPPRYNPRVKREFAKQIPDIFICGHSHILRAKRDAALNGMLYLNPGAAGNQGFHAMRTIMRFKLHNKEVLELEAIELGKRGVLPAT